MNNGIGTCPGAIQGDKAQYFIGYSVTFAGSLIGFLWAFACGLAVGYVGSWLYNAVAHLRHQRRAP